MLGDGGAPGNQDVLISSLQPDLPSSVTTQLGTTTSRHFARRSATPQRRTRRSPKQADVFVQTLPCHPTRTLHSNTDTGKPPLFWVEGVMAVSTEQTAFVGLLPFKPKATTTKKKNHNI